uniref:Uncharacterized protein n=1 Tax=Glossina pallidipes TaxID=7398 RepID=A0A1B0A781_GLOPL
MANAEDLLPNVEELLANTEELLPNMEELLANTEELLPKMGELWANTEELLPNMEELLANTEELLANTEELLPNMGELLPNMGELLANAEELLPKMGELLANTEELLPNMEELLANTEELLPNMGELLANTEELLPNFGGVWPKIEPLDKLLILLSKMLDVGCALSAVVSPRTEELLSNIRGNGVVGVKCALLSSSPGYLLSVFSPRAPSATLPNLEGPLPDFARLFGLKRKHRSQFLDQYSLRLNGRPLKTPSLSEDSTIKAAELGTIVVIGMADKLIDVVEDVVELNTPVAGIEALFKSKSTLGVMISLFGVFATGKPKQLGKAHEPKIEPSDKLVPVPPKTDIDCVLSAAVDVEFATPEKIDSSPTFPISVKPPNILPGNGIIGVKCALLSSSSSSRAPSATLPNLEESLPDFPRLFGLKKPTLSEDSSIRVAGLGAIVVIGIADKLMNVVEDVVELNTPVAGIEALLKPKSTLGVMISLFEVDWIGSDGANIVLAAPAAGNPKLKVLLIGAAILETVDLGDTLLVTFSLLTITGATDVVIAVAILKGAVVDLFKLLKILASAAPMSLQLEIVFIDVLALVTLETEVNDEIVPVTLEVQFINVVVLVVQELQPIETPVFAANELPNLKLAGNENVVNLKASAAVERTTLGIPDSELDPSAKIEQIKICFSRKMFLYEQIV